MNTIEDLIIDLKQLPALVQDGVDRAILGDSVDVVKINIDQLKSGLDVEGSPLGEYVESTKAIRNRRGLQTSFIDLDFTGRSQKSITTKKINDSKFILDSNPDWDLKRFPNAIGISKKGESELDAIIIQNIDAILNQKFR